MIEDHSVSNLHFVLLSPAFRLCFEEGLTLETSTSQTRYSGQFKYLSISVARRRGPTVSLETNPFVSCLRVIVCQVLE